MHPQKLDADGTSRLARTAFKGAQTVVIKVGSAVVQRADGLLAMGRIGSIVEQVALLRKEGKRVVFVASGAIGIGGQRVAEQKVLSQSIRAHLQGKGPPSAGHAEPLASARARAAAGQGGLMGLYDTLFAHFSVVCGQILVAEDDFQDVRLPDLDPRAFGPLVATPCHRHTETVSD